MNALAYEAASQASLTHSVRQGVLLGSSVPDNWQGLSITPALRKAKGGNLYFEFLDFTEDSLYLELSDDGLSESLKKLLAGEVRNFNECISEPRYLVGDWHSGYDDRGVQIWNQHTEELEKGIDPLTAMRLIAAKYIQTPEFQRIEIVYEAPLRRYAF